MKCNHICNCACHEENSGILHIMACCEICCHCSERIDYKFSQYGNKEHNDKCYDGQEITEVKHKLTKEEYIKELIRLA